jgi:hypothetical protein
MDGVGVSRMPIWVVTFFDGVRLALREYFVEVVLNI